MGVSKKELVKQGRLKAVRKRRRDGVLTTVYVRTGTSAPPVAVAPPLPATADAGATRTAEPVADPAVTVALPPNITKTLKPVVDAFTAQGETVYLVGGAVRDAHLGEPVKDLDLCSRLHPDEVKRLIAPLAEATWDAGETFGTVAFQHQGEIIEITTFRDDSYDGETRKPTVAFGSSITDDLKRRDLTINSVAYDLVSKRVVDPHGGLNDLRSGVLRTPTDPSVSFSDDPLRILRVARFATRFDFAVHDDTATAMREFSPEISRISVERVCTELTKIAEFRNSWRGWELLDESGVGEVIGFPELHAAVKNRKRSPKRSLRRGGKRAFAEVGLADLFMEASGEGGEPFPRGVVSGRLLSLRFPKHVASTVETTVHASLAVERLGDTVTEKDVRIVGKMGEGVFTSVSNVLSERGTGAAFARVAGRLERSGENVLGMSLGDGVDGRWVSSVLNIPPGRKVGEALQKLWEVRLAEGPVGKERMRRALLEWGT